MEHRRKAYFEIELSADCAMFGIGGWHRDLHRPTPGSAMNFMIGLISPNIDHDRRQPCSTCSKSRSGSKLCDHAYQLSTASGGLYGNGKTNSNPRGPLKVGDRVGVLVDLAKSNDNDEPNVVFFVNGVEYGCFCRAEGPLVFGVRLMWEGQAVTIMQDAQDPNDK